MNDFRIHTFSQTTTIESSENVLLDPHNDIEPEALMASLRSFTSEMEHYTKVHE